MNLITSVQMVLQTKQVEQIADRNVQAMIYLRIRVSEEAPFLSAFMASSMSQPSLLA
jgi:hypothetical protein